MPQHACQGICPFDVNWIDSVWNRLYIWTSTLICYSIDQLARTAIKSLGTYIVHTILFFFMTVPGACDYDNMPGPSTKWQRNVPRNMDEVTVFVLY